MYNPKIILVTGGSGFIGSHYIEHVLTVDSKVRVINLDALTYAANPLFSDLMKNKYPGRHDFIRANICDQAALTAVFTDHNIDTVVHFAAETHVDNSLHQQELFLQTNVIGTNTLLQTSLMFWQKRFMLDPQLCRFHHISTDEVYGTLELNAASSFNENSPYRPNSPYSASKASSDHVVRCYSKSYQLPTTMTNTSNNFGPRQHREKFIPTIIRSCLLKQNIPVYGDGKNIRDWLYVKDHCSMIHAVIKQGEVGEHYNIGGNHEISNIHLCETITRLMNQNSHDSFDHRQLITHVQDRPGHDLRYAIDMSKYVSNIGPFTYTHFEKALQSVINDELKQLNISNFTNRNFIDENTTTR